jgi:nucleoside-diphosphate-sugar epimerase
MYKAASGQVPSGALFLTKSFDSTPWELAGAIAAATSRNVQLKKEGILSASSLPRYTSEQLKASVRIEEQPSWKELGYSPEYDLKKTCEEIANWYRKEPWILEGD